MGPPESPTNPSQNQATTPCRRRQRPIPRPRRRRCLLKGCKERFRPQRARERYCSARCREGARKWSRWKAQEKYRGTPEGKQKRNGQSRRYRERVRNRKAPGKEALPEAARVITKNFFRSCLRPAGLLRGVHVQPQITPPAVLLEGVPTGVGARPEEGAALERGTGPIRSARKAILRGEVSRRFRTSKFDREIVPTY